MAEVFSPIAKTVISNYSPWKLFLSVIPRTQHYCCRMFHSLDLLLWQLLDKSSLLRFEHCKNWSRYLVWKWSSSNGFSWITTSTGTSLNKMSLNQKQSTHKWNYGKKKLKYRKQLMKQLEKQGTGFYLLLCCVFICFLNSHVRGGTKFSFWSNISNGKHSKFPTLTNTAENHRSKLCLQTVSEDTTDHCTPYQYLPSNALNTFITLLRSTLNVF